MVRNTLVAALAASTVATAKPFHKKRDASVSTVHFPLNYKSGPNNKVSTAVYVPWANTTIDVVYDQGSENFWMLGPNATVNWGCTSLACQGQCNYTETVYDYTKSSTAQVEAFGSQYIYGGFDKIVQGDIAVNNTLTFVNVAGVESTVQNIEFAIDNYLQNRLSANLDGTCGSVPVHDVAILGVSPYQHNAMRNTTGPAVRKNLLDEGKIGANVHSIWFDEAPEDPLGTYTGGGLMGGIDTSKYTGPLVKVPYYTPELELQAQTVGYYVSVPQVSVGDVKFNVSTDSENCFLDSGTQADEIPVPYEDSDYFNNVTGIVKDPEGHLAWPSDCADIPADRTIDFTWAGVNANETVTIKVPIRSYVRNNISPAGYCTLNVSPGGCLLAGPFTTAAFFAADDEREEVALAQGAVSARGSGVDTASVVERIP